MTGLVRRVEIFLVAESPQAAANFTVSRAFIAQQFSSRLRTCVSDAVETQTEQSITNTG